MEQANLTISLSESVKEKKSPKIGEIIDLKTSNKKLPAKKQYTTSYIYIVLALVVYALYFIFNSSFTAEYVSKYLFNRGSFIGVNLRGIVIAGVILLISYAYEYIQKN